ncbi:kinase-like protein [Atractiella rhizophila]|nr:kinase-like protein [Atractiella rhizophila]
MESKISTRLKNAIKKNASSLSRASSISLNPNTSSNNISPNPSSASPNPALASPNPRHVSPNPNATNGTTLAIPPGKGRTSRSGSAPKMERPKGAIEDKFPMYSGDRCVPSHYKLHEPIGFGASSTVFRATFWPLVEGWKEGMGEEKEREMISGFTEGERSYCAVKVIDIDRIGCGWEGVDRLRRETQLMSLSKHPNLLRVRGEWVLGSKLYIATRLMRKGSILDIMRHSHPSGFPEPIIATIMKQCLEGLAYLHTNGWLHRDIKAGNLLVDHDGTVLLADFGVSSSVLHYSDHKQKKMQKGRKSFVGTPCYMAPEVVLGREYDYKGAPPPECFPNSLLNGCIADIYSYGITLLELSLGRAPSSLFSPDKVLLKTIHEDSPTLEREPEGVSWTYSRSMKEMVDLCLQKNPSKRPTAATLLAHPFFRSARKESYLVSEILKDLPPLEKTLQRRKKPSTQTLTHHKHLSWDFHSVHSSSPGPGGHGHHEDEDPFEHFAGVGPASRRSRDPSHHDRSVSFDFGSGSLSRRSRSRSREAGGAKRHVSDLFREENMKEEEGKESESSESAEGESSGFEGRKAASTTSEESAERNGDKEEAKS